jgi:hypothetical protein
MPNEENEMYVYMHVRLYLDAVLQCSVPLIECIVSINVFLSPLIEYVVSTCVFLTILLQQFHFFRLDAVCL